MVIMNKIANVLILFFLIGCSSVEEIDMSNSSYVFEKQNIVSFIKDSKKYNAELNPPLNNLNNFNAKSNNLSNSKVSFPLKKIWDINTDQKIEDTNPLFPEPIFILSSIYLINSNGQLLKVNSNNGKIVWKNNIFEDPENAIIGPPSIAGEYISKDVINIYIHSGNNELFSVNGITGKVNWKRTFKLPFRGGITFFEKQILLSDYVGDVFSINSNDGKINWKTSLSTDYNSVYTLARPIIAKDKVIVPGTGGSFFVLSLMSGKIIWSDNISSRSQLPKVFHTGDIVGNPIYFEGIVYVVSQSGYTSAFDIETAEKIWTLPIGGIETPILSGKTIFIIGNMGILVAVDRFTGEVRWQNKYESKINVDSYFSDEAIAIYKAPLLADSKLLFPDHYGDIRILDADKGIEMDILSIGKLAISPIAVNKKIFFLRADGKLLAYE